MSAFHLRLVCKRKMQWLPASKILFNTLKARNACLQSVQILGLLGTICAAFVKESILLCAFSQEKQLVHLALRGCETSPVGPLSALDKYGVPLLLPRWHALGSVPRPQHAALPSVVHQQASALTSTPCVSGPGGDIFNGQPWTESGATTLPVPCVSAPNRSVPSAFAIVLKTIGTTGEIQQASEPVLDTKSLYLLTEVHSAREKHQMNGVDKQMHGLLGKVKGEANVPSPTEPQTIISNGRNLLADVCTRTLQWRRSRAHLETCTYCRGK
eukprot:1157463-Pelagomonas_calceolata.AAC.1